MVAALALFALQWVHVDALTHAWLVLQLHRFGDPPMARLATMLHMTGAKMWVPLVAAGIVYVVIMLSDRLFGFAHRAIVAVRHPVAKAKAQPVTPTDVQSEEDRAKLYKEYRKIEAALKEAKKRQCTFLSVDVVGSTGMKQGENELAITATFRAYEELLKRTFKATHAWKESWTPDGVMILFQNRDDAVAAAQTILEKLLAFNEKDNTLKTRFDVRCGINEGEVVVFDDSDVEKLVDHVIDVAGHMQKYAKPGSLLLSADVFKMLGNQSGFVPTEQEVDGYKTYAWTPQPASTAQAAASMESP